MANNLLVKFLESDRIKEILSLTSMFVFYKAIFFCKQKVL